MRTVWHAINRAASTVSVAQTGLDFPSNGGGSTVQMRQTGAAMPDITPLTLIWRVKPRQQTGFYTTFFHGRTDGSFVGDNKYFGCHPYPQGGSGGTVHNWEISVNGGDVITDDNAHSTVVTKDVWYTQAAVTYGSGADTIVKFYWDLPDTTKVITWTQFGGLVNATDSPALTFGDAPWSETNERLSGVLRGLQAYNAQLSQADIVTEAANDSSNTPQTSAGIAAKWFLNQNPTPDDITDKSGAGHDFVWINANRPTLWSGP